VNSTRQLGERGEKRAAEYLQGQGLRIVEKHFQTRWGEIDLICRHKKDWVFVEVKTRSRAAQPSALDAITPAKCKRLVNAALMYMKKRRLEGENMRFDVVSLEADAIEWIPGAFEASSDYTF
jgi:putative endonuclease